MDTHMGWHILGVGAAEHGRDGVDDHEPHLCSSEARHSTARAACEAGPWISHKMRACTYVVLLHGQGDAAGDDVLEVGGVRAVLNQDVVLPVAPVVHHIRPSR
jgi:hypothetical protein